MGTCSKKIRKGDSAVNKARTGFNRSRRIKRDERRKSKKFETYMHRGKLAMAGRIARLERRIPQRLQVCPEAGRAALKEHLRDVLANLKRHYELAFG